MKKKLLFIRSQYAVSEVLDIILILVIVSAAISSLLLVVVPYIEDQKDYSHFGNVAQQFLYVDALFSDMVKSGRNTSRDFTISMEDGVLFVDEESDILVICYALSSDYNFSVSRIDDRDSSFDITGEQGCDVINQADILWLNTGLEESHTGLNIQGTVTVNAGYDIADAVRVDLKNNANDVVGRIWFFDLGCLSYNLQTGSGVLGVYLENNGVITYSGGSYLIDEPVLFIKNNKLFLRVLQIQTSDNVVFSGRGGYSFSAVVNNSQLYVDEEEVYNLRIDIYGDYRESWTRFLENQSLFSNGLHYWDELGFSLLHLLFDVNVEEVT